MWSLWTQSADGKTGSEKSRAHQRAHSCLVRTQALLSDSCPACCTQYHRTHSCSGPLEGQSPTLPPSSLSEPITSRARGQRGPCHIRYGLGDIQSPLTLECNRLCNLQGSSRKENAGFLVQNYEEFQDSKSIKLSLSNMVPSVPRSMLMKPVLPRTHTLPRTNSPFTGKSQVGFQGPQEDRPWEVNCPPAWLSQWAVLGCSGPYTLIFQVTSTCN